MLQFSDVGQGGMDLPIWIILMPKRPSEHTLGRIVATLVNNFEGAKTL